MDKASQDKKAAESLQGLAAVAASLNSKSVIVAAENGNVNVLSIDGNAGAGKEVYHVAKNTDGTFKVHSIATNATT
jgi:hypothetical protein